MKDKNHSSMGEYEDPTIDEKTSKLPKWLLDRGLMNYYDCIESRQDMKKSIELWRTMDHSEKIKEHTIKRFEKDLNDFKIKYFNASDVERFYRWILEKYELIEKDRILKSRPQDIGKKNYVCEDCGWETWTKHKPKQCKKCGGKNITEYHRI